MSRAGWIAAALSVCAWQLTPQVAEACGGFFCSRVPVDQNAERVVFHVRADGTTEMIVQITYAGQDEDFAWVLPVGTVPENRETFPQMALNALDSGTAPQFRLNPECRNAFDFARDGDGPVFAGGGTGGTPQNEGAVTVHVREEVGPYDVAVISSEDAGATMEWLKTNGYNIAQTMAPYIRLYTAEQMKFLALRLTADAEANDIVPFKMTLPGQAPGIPLRLTALAAEPEMGVKVWIFADQRFGPANAEEVEVDLDALRWEPYSFGQVNNWSALVAREVDRYAGMAWVAEVAGDTEELRTQIEGSPTNTEEQQLARDALLTLLGDSAYMTRLYTRVSPEEMVYDPTFKRSSAGDVAQVKELPYVQELCTDEEPIAPEPCDYAACGALGLCRNVSYEDDSGNTRKSAACACAPGTTARTTFAPDGSVTVSCQEERMSFMNPGERTLRSETFPDNCAGFDCGEHGKCVSMNLTPTCECDRGYVAYGWLDTEGQRRTRCTPPSDEIDEAFYNRRPLERPEDLPVGREVPLDAARGEPDVVVVDHGAAEAARPATGGCASLAVTSPSHSAGWAAALALGTVWWGRRRRSW